MKISKATPKDLDQLMTILEDGRNQLAEQGIDQWQGDYPNRQHIKEDIDNGFAYLVHSDDEQTIGAFSVVTPPDHSYDELDGHWLLDTQKYRTIHRVAIHSNHAGHGYASQLFESVIDYFQDVPEVESLRIDTHEDNKAMQHLITKHGFTRVGTLHGVYRPNEESYVYEMLTQGGDGKNTMFKD
ncbi:GNAT family N-acetyltransferase [Limosilactobacillus difficilis]|uniref:GNAT family N-acetyltransferase n=1 Tax=Limosilactobacillus difficilis TaxID=2991838 RepID=UPI0024BAC832|nr:GNAT family N-acetyltransferase [Limosilactobacillus difficilis]